MKYCKLFYCKKQRSMTQNHTYTAINLVTLHADIGKATDLWFTGRGFESWLDTLAWWPFTFTRVPLLPLPSSRAIIWYRSRSKYSKVRATVRKTR